jgi:hypothetical protein
VTAKFKAYSRRWSTSDNSLSKTGKEYNISRISKNPTMSFDELGG